MAKERRKHSEEHVIRTGVFLYTVPGKYTYKVETELPTTVMRSHPPCCHLLGPVTEDRLLQGATAMIVDKLPDSTPRDISNVDFLSSQALFLLRRSRASQIGPGGRVIWCSTVPTLRSLYFLLGALLQHGSKQE